MLRHRSRNYSAGGQKEIHEMGAERRLPRILPNQPLRKQVYDGVH